MAVIADIYGAVTSSRLSRNSFHPLEAIRIFRYGKGGVSIPAHG
jgi:HD-GYP domain-containing protein (c-di-GMP phosphodiesterase class II)